MANIEQVFGAQTALTITINNLANGSSATATAVDLTTPGPLRINLTANLLGLASGTGLAEVYAQWSDDNTDFSDDTNDHLVGTVQMNAAVAVKKVFAVDVVGRYVKFRVTNSSGAAMGASGNTMEYAPVHMSSV